MVGWAMMEEGVERLCIFSCSSLKYSMRSLLTDEFLKRNFSSLWRRVSFVAVGAKRGVDEDEEESEEGEEEEGEEEEGEDDDVGFKEDDDEVEVEEEEEDGNEF